MQLVDVVDLAIALPTVPDDRPPWLVALEPNDGTCLYYRLFHELVKRFGPLRILEIGTNMGQSAAHLSYANHGGSVTTIDINPDSAVATAKLPLTNIVQIIMDSTQAYPVAEAAGPFDLLYIDGWHSFNQTYGEYVLYRQIVKDGGLIFFDDIELEMETDELRIAWSYIREPKVLLQNMHHTGFGVAQKQDSLIPSPWEVLVNDASAKMARARESWHSRKPGGGR